MDADGVPRAGFSLPLKPPQTWQVSRAGVNSNSTLQIRKTSFSRISPDLEQDFGDPWGNWKGLKCHLVNALVSTKTEQQMTKHRAGLGACRPRGQATASCVASALGLSTPFWRILGC